MTLVPYGSSYPGANLVAIQYMVNTLPTIGHYPSVDPELSTESQTTDGETGNSGADCGW